MSNWRYFSIGVVVGVVCTSLCAVGVALCQENPQEIGFENMLVFGEETEYINLGNCELEFSVLDNHPFLTISDATHTRVEELEKWAQGGLIVEETTEGVLSVRVYTLESYYGGRTWRAFVRVEVKK